MNVAVNFNQDCSGQKKLNEPMACSVSGRLSDIPVGWGHCTAKLPFQGKNPSSLLRALPFHGCPSLFPPLWVHEEETGWPWVSSNQRMTETYRDDSKEIPTRNMASSPFCPNAGGHLFKIVLPVPMTCSAASAMIFPRCRNTIRSDISSISRMLSGVQHAQSVSRYS